MWRYHARRNRTYLALWAIAAVALVGAGSPFKKQEKPPKVEETVTNLASIFTSSHNSMRLEGVGLVVGLDNTGSEPPPSWYRERLVDEMRKAGVENAEKLLADPSVSIVIARLTIPTGSSKNDRLDVELELPPACGTTSLAGGYLVECRLKEVAIAGGTPKEGQELALAKGPVMIGTDAKPDDPKVGRVLGGARVKKDSPFRLELKENRKSFKSSQMLQNVVNHRFHQTEGVKHNGMATAKTDSFLELRVPKVYKHNQNRYFRVIKLLPLVESPQLTQMRMATWGEELLDPTKAGIAALRLEGLGVTAIETLKKGLVSPNEQVRFFAAEALAYLNDASGADVLGDHAIKNAEFRPFALAALAATDQSASRMKLVKLMEVPEIPVRYGAFDALRTLDESDPFLGRVKVLEDPKDDSDDSETIPMAISWSSRSHRSHRADPFSLYVVDTDGPPLVHLARTKRCEIVVFGRGQRMLTPIVLGNGPILLNAADGDHALQISKIGTGREGDQDAKVNTSLDIDDVIRQTAGLGAKYPDIVTILQGAARQKNLPGPLVVDAVPVPTTDYLQAAILGKDTTKKDDEVSKTSAEVPRRRFFGLFGKDPKKDKDKDKETDGEKGKDDAKPAESKKDEPKADAPKTDEAIKKSSQETTEKRSLLDRLRRR
ncbi:flagellar basal body P-ring protein FlgI [Singulisphaera acidiphila]|uniref:Flagellar basal-body P-ring protein n=1 Tax=Singulisphaera acidiphila (strain ATCC BAA-1392 / DSM 18658 / VKM B-2454 / MOB10) TaxID=886293 RepID=L0DDN4_SINAD|nr:flagellar basal body P-ring protein FlgI [Singulisphaera acidiphila]AGA26970.1 flagellar basal-body P-ring protein [Singulisphaera acidiphila DSM 18658]